MDLISFTRQLIDIESITGNEAAVGNFLLRELSALGYHTSAMPVAPQDPDDTGSARLERFNIYAFPSGQPKPSVVFSTHMDTVPPFIPSSEHSGRIYGRGSCDAKGILAAQVAASERLRKENIGVGLLFVAGEERDSMGAIVANEQPKHAKYLINGEPTENRLALASKGTLRVVITAHGRAAHSAYPELGESAIENLLDALDRLRRMELPVNPEIGPATMNIGIIEGGSAPNVIPDHARAQLLYRLVGATDELKHSIRTAVSGVADVEFALEIPYMRMHTIDGLPTMVAAFTTDVPALSNWGKPLLIGPGSIHVAHTEGEYIEKDQLLAAVDLYCEIAKKLE